jgi:hypothetical protein
MNTHAQKLSGLLFGAVAFAGLAGLGMQRLNRPQRAALAFLLPVKNSVDGRLRGADFLGDAGLGPLGLCFDFTQKVWGLFVHTSNIRECIRYAIRERMYFCKWLFVYV